MRWLMASLTENTIPDESVRLEWCFSFWALSALPKWTTETSESCVVLQPPLWTSQWPFSSVGGRAAFHLTLQTLLQWSTRPEKILHTGQKNHTGHVRMEGESSAGPGSERVNVLGWTSEKSPVELENPAETHNRRCPSQSVQEQKFV